MRLPLRILHLLWLALSAWGLSGQAGLAEEIYNPPYRGGQKHPGLLGGVDSAVDLKLLADQADMVLIGVVDHPRIIRQSLEQVAERGDSSKRLREANVRVYERVRLKQRHYGFIEEMKLQFESYELKFGDHYLFFIKFGTNDKGRRSYEVLHHAKVTSDSENKTYLSHNMGVKTDLLRKVLRDWAYGMTEDNFAAEFASSVASNPGHVRLAPFLRLTTVRPTWEQELRDAFCFNREQVQRFSVISHDTILRGSDDDIRALLKLASQQQRKDGKPGEDDAWLRFREYHIYHLLRRYADGRLAKLLTEHAEDNLLARVSAAHALARMQGAEAVPVIERWQKDERMEKIVYRSTFDDWFSPHNTALTYLAEALEVAEGKIKDKTPEEYREHYRAQRAQQLQDKLAELNSDDPENREKAKESLLRGGQEAYEAMQVVARGPDDDLAARVKQMLHQMEVARLAQWFSYHGVGASVYDDQLQEITLELSSYRSREDQMAMIEAIRKLPHLKRLATKVSEHWDIYLPHMADMTQIESLRLDGPGVTDEGLSFLTKLTNLQKLDLNGTPITDKGLKPLAGLVNLKQLNLRYTEITDEGLQYLSKLQALESLNLASSKVTGPGLKHLDGLPALKDLKLHHGKVTDLRGLKNLPALENLELYYSPVNDEGLQNIGHLTSLKILRLVGPDVTDVSLPEIGKLTNLEELSLREGKITDAGLKPLESLINLRKLNLSSTQLTDAGLTSLSKLKNLQELSISGTAVTDAGLEFLQELKSLTYLGLHNTAVSLQAMKKFQQAVPGCRFSN